jgi:hypothetical protein
MSPHTCTLTPPQSLCHRHPHITHTERAPQRLTLKLAIETHTETSTATLTERPSHRELKDVLLRTRTQRLLTEETSSIQGSSSEQYRDFRVLTQMSQNRTPPWTSHRDSEGDLLQVGPQRLPNAEMSTVASYCHTHSSQSPTETSLSLPDFIEISDSQRPYTATSV